MEKLFYTTIMQHTEHEIPKIKGSRFIGNIFPIQTKEDVENALQEIKKKYPDANHHCYAYRYEVSLQKDIFNNNIYTTKQNKSSDDGEPASTAGKPIMNIIEKSNIHNILIIVTRYFGGTLLGVGGLIQAYSECAKKTLEIAQKKETEIVSKISFSYIFEQIQNIRSLVNKYQGKIIQEQYDKDISITIEINSGYQESFRKELSDSSKGSIKI